MFSVVFFHLYGFFYRVSHFMVIKYGNIEKEKHKYEENESVKNSIENEPENCISSDVYLNFWSNYKQKRFFFSSQLRCNGCFYVWPKSIGLCLSIQEFFFSQYFAFYNYHPSFSYNTVFFVTLSISIDIPLYSN